MGAADLRSEQLDRLAAIVRGEVEAHVRDCGVGTHSWLGFVVHSRTLAGWCGIASAVLVATYRAHDIRAEVAAGDFDWSGEEGDSEHHHCWVLVPAPYQVPAAQWTAYATLMDITGTQYPHFRDRPVVRLDPGHRDRDYYLLGGTGDPLAFSGARDDEHQAVDIIHPRRAPTGQAEGIDPDALLHELGARHVDGLPLRAHVVDPPFQERCSRAREGPGPCAPAPVDEEPGAGTVLRRTQPALDQLGRR